MGSPPGQELFDIDVIDLDIIEGPIVHIDMTVRVQRADDGHSALAGRWFVFLIHADSKAPLWRDGESLSWAVVRNR